MDDKQQAELSAAEASAKQELDKQDTPKDDAPVQAPPDEPQEEEVAEETPEETPEPAEEEPEPAQPPPSRRENKRIEQLTRKLAEYESRSPAPVQSPPQNNQIIGEGDYDVDEINQRASQYGQQMYDQGLNQSQIQANANMFATRLEIDTPRVAQKYPMLDQNSEQFDPGIAALLNEEFLRIVGYDPNSGAVQNNNIRYEEYIDTQIDKAERLNAIRGADSQKNLARQAAQTGLRPSGVSKEYQGDDPKKMTNKQLEEAINSSLGLK